eukprot:TRINITY_DN16349_c0_g1_i1.p1 TRINITY_DN16349_c0_g1~~TRINITY_DN16349_c0_g1_i1.p1  ORF type:complete len:263 (-),score=55.49 TRINITY_DN16349_c0_g1_i1:623-1411(-)
MGCGSSTDNAVPEASAGGRPQRSSSPRSGRLMSKRRLFGNAMPMGYFQVKLTKENIKQELGVTLGLSYKPMGVVVKKVCEAGLVAKHNTSYLDAPERQIGVGSIIVAVNSVCDDYERMLLELAKLQFEVTVKRVEVVEDQDSKALDDSPKHSLIESVAEPAPAPTPMEPLSPTSVGRTREVRLTLPMTMPAHLVAAAEAAASVMPAKKAAARPRPLFDPPFTPPDEDLPVPADIDGTGAVPLKEDFDDTSAPNAYRSCSCYS